MSESTSVADLFAELLKRTEERADAMESLYRALADQGLLSKVTLHRYQCKRGCQIATVFRAGSTTLCAVRDYKYSRGLNAAQSVASARAKNTLDGDRWWPSHVYDVEEIADWGPETGMQVACRHYRGLLAGGAVLDDVRGVTPGKPNKPTRL